MVNQPRHSRATLKGLLIHSFTDSHKNMCSTYDEIMRRGEVAKPINYADSVYTLRSKRSPAHILSRTPSRKNGSERVYTVSLAEQWASSRWKSKRKSSYSALSISDFNLLARSIVKRCVASGFMCTETQKFAVSSHNS